MSTASRVQREADCGAGSTIWLPVDVGRPCFVAVYEAWGIRFGEQPCPPEACAMCRPAALPPGWRIERDEGSLRTRLLDAGGRVRARIFGSTHDNDPGGHLRMIMAMRFAVEVDYDRHDADGCGVASVTDHGRVVYRTRAYEEVSEHLFGSTFAARADAEGWLDEHWPLWREPGAYLDEAP